MQLLKIDYDGDLSELDKEMKENIIAVRFWTDEDVHDEVDRVTWDMSSLRHRHEKEKLKSCMVGINGKRQGLAGAIRYPPDTPAIRFSRHIREGGLSSNGGIG
jgi:hypothetical protein